MKSHTLYNMKEYGQRSGKRIIPVTIQPHIQKITPRYGKETMKATTQGLSTILVNLFQTTSKTMLEK